LSLRQSGSVHLDNPNGTAILITDEKKVRYAVVGGGQITQKAFMPGIGQTDNLMRWSCYPIFGGDPCQ
jgi:hypothetical protein